MKLLPYILWCTLFSSPAFVLAQSRSEYLIRKTLATRIVDLRPIDDTIIHTLRDYSPDSLLSAILYKAVIDHSIVAYSSERMTLTDTLSAVAIAERMSPVDYIVDNGDTLFNTCKNPIGFRFNQVQFKVAEEWTMNVKTQETTIETKAIGLLNYQGDVTYKPGSPLFWLRYTDIKNILDRYEQYHPDNTLALHIWADYFLSDKKPTPIK